VKLTRSPARAAWHALSLHESEREREEGDGRRLSLTLTEGEDTKKKKCRLLAPNAEKRVQKFGGKDEKRGRLVGKRMDALFANFASLVLCSISLFFVFFWHARHLFALVATKINTSFKITKNYGRFESQRYARDARARHANRCFRSRNALDRTVLVLRRRGTFFIAIERGNFSEKEFDQISLSLFCFS
jgi:hypothetical protein